MSFEVTANFHPTLTALGQLDEVRAWFLRVFQRPCDPPSKTFLMDGYSDDYCFTTMLQEVLFDTMDPSRFSSRNNPRPNAETPPFLSVLAFYVDDHDALIAAANRQGLQLRDIKGELMTGETPPAVIPHGVATLTDPRQAGYVYEFFTVGTTPKHLLWGAEVDPRFEPGWRQPSVSPDDPLALELCAWHTLLSDEPERLRKLFVDLLGGRVIHEGPNDALGTHSVYVALGDGVYELGRPVQQELGMALWRAHAGGMDDGYIGMTFKTADLQKARTHLIAQGVGLIVDGPDLIMTDPKDSIGVSWGFTTRLVSGDIRPA